MGVTGPFISFFKLLVDSWVLALYSLQQLERTSIIYNLHFAVLFVLTSVLQFLSYSQNFYAIHAFLRQ